MSGKQSMALQVVINDKHICLSLGPMGVQVSNNTVDLHTLTIRVYLICQKLTLVKVSYSHIQSIVNRPASTQNQLTRPCMYF